MEKSLRAALARAVNLLDSHGYRFALIGGLAVSIWGHTRATYDIDIKVLVPETDYKAVQNTLRTAFPLRARPHVPENPLIIDTKIDGVIVDFLLALPGYEENIIHHAVVHELDELKIPVSSPEDLIIQKVVAGRPQDWHDCEGILLESSKRLDYGYIDEWLGQFSEALEKPEMLQQYQNIRSGVAALLRIDNNIENQID
ncbi:MAG: nucleotidyltransferase [Candidatus Xenobiia bacterium LiM19]